MRVVVDPALLTSEKTMAHLRAECLNGAAIHGHCGPEVDGVIEGGTAVSKVATHEDETTTRSFVESEELFHERAIRAAGLSDFGDPSYREGMRVALRALDTEARLHEAGRASVRAGIVDMLTERLRSEEQLRRHPEVLQVPIPRPIFITGCVRTGGTALQYLMGADPALQVLPAWLSAKPQPRPPRATWESNPDFQAVQAGLDAYHAVDPRLQAMHFRAAAWPDECGPMMRQDFTDDYFEVVGTVPSYEHWFHDTRHPHTYIRHRKLVQLIGSTHPDRRWLFKYGAHLRELDTLLDVYPDACIVYVHRDPCEVISSYTGMVAIYRALHERDIDRHDIARTQMVAWGEASNRALGIRDRHASTQFFDIYYEEFIADPMGSVKRIYAYFQQPLSAESEAALNKHHANNPQHKHGKHQYSTAQTGLTERQIRDAFGPYLERYFPASGK